MPFEKWAIRRGDALGNVYEVYRISRKLRMAKFYLGDYRDGFILVNESAYEVLGVERLNKLFVQCSKKKDGFFLIDRDGVTTVGKRTPHFG